MFKLLAQGASLATRARSASMAARQLHSGPSPLLARFVSPSARHRPLLPFVTTGSARVLHGRSNDDDDRGARFQSSSGRAARPAFPGLLGNLHPHRLLHTSRLAAGISKAAKAEVNSMPSTHGAEGALNTAIIANCAILVSKLGVFLASGSSSILAEAVHSVVDIANQLLLRTGLARSLRKPDVYYNYGYRREVFVWSLISGVGIFCLGAGVSIVHGFHSLMHPSAEIEHLGASLAVLLISFVIESYSLSVAYKALEEGAALANMTIRQYVRLGMDPTSVSVVCEDGAAVLGLVVAASCLMLTKATGNAAYDAVGSIVVGTLLGAVAVFLIQTNRKALIGRSLTTQKIEQIIAMLREDPVVADVLDAKSEEIGPGVFRFKAEIEFDGDAIVRRYLEGSSRSTGAERRDRLLALFQAATRTSDSRALEAALKEYGQKMVTAVGDEVDRLEELIRLLEPSIKHVDIETN